MRRTLNNRLKRLQLRRQAIFIVCISILVPSLAVLVFAVTPSSSDAGNQEASVNDAAEVEVGGVEVVQSGFEDSPPVSLGIGGDVCFGLEVADIVSARGPDYPWSEISPLFAGYDFTALNLEGPLCSSGEPNPNQVSFSVRGSEKYAPCMAEAGVDAVCLANDHVMDYGSEGLEETLKAVGEQGIRCFGAGLSRDAAEQPAVLKGENGGRVALLAFCDVAPSSYAAGEDVPGLAEADPARVRELVGKAAMEEPHVVVFIHWGNVGSAEITSRQRELAHVCAEAGADLVVGSHPHIIQGIELWKGVPVLYSLGNLVFHSRSLEGRDGLLAGCSFTGGELAGLQLLPIGVEEARPASLEGGEAERVLMILADRSPGVRMEIDTEAGEAEIVLE